jgi:hypothetical protein
VFNYQEISDTELICLHEASHAVLAFLLGFQILSIVINQDEKSGICWRYFKPDREPIIPELQNISETQKHVMVGCAGYASKAVITNSNQCWDYSMDYANAVQLLKPKYDKGIIKVYIESVMAWVIELLEQYWGVVETLTDALLWLPERGRFDDYPGSDFEDLLPSDYFEAPEQWSMGGGEAEQIIQRALIAYGLAL